MFEIGEHVIHPGQGVCEVVGYEDSPTPAILLEAKTGRTVTRMKYPVAMSSRLHPTVSREEAEALLNGYDELECDPFTERNSSLEESHFKQQIKLGAPETVRVAKTMRCRIHDAEARNKKPSSYYARILKEAHRRSVEELAVALDVSEDEMNDRINSMLEQAEPVMSAN